MTETGTVFVGIDAAKTKHAVAVAEPGRSGEVRYIGEIDAAADAVPKLLTRLAVTHGKLHVCYGWRHCRQRPNRVWIVQAGHQPWP